MHTEQWSSGGAGLKYYNGGWTRHHPSKKVAQPQPRMKTTLSTTTMPQNIASTSKNDKAKAHDRPPSHGTPNLNSNLTTTPTLNSPAIPPLHQLKQAIKNTPGIIKNAKDALYHLTTKQWLVPHQDITNTQLASILLSLVTSSGQHSTSEKILENVANVIKAIAFLIKEAMVTRYAETIANHLAGNPTLHLTQHTTVQINAETTGNILETLETLNKSIQEQIKHVKNTEKIHKIQNSLPDMNTNASYRDTLINGTHNNLATQSPPANITEAKLQNRINIEACQILIEVQ